MVVAEGVVREGPVVAPQWCLRVLSATGSFCSIVLERAATVSLRVCTSSISAVRDISWSSALDVPSRVKNVLLGRVPAKLSMRGGGVRFVVSVMSPTPSGALWLNKNVSIIFRYGGVYRVSLTH